MTKNEKYIRLGLNIAYYRKLKGLTQLQLAEAIEAPNISTSVSLDTLFEIAEALDIPIHQLFIFRD